MIVALFNNPANGTYDNRYETTFIRWIKAGFAHIKDN